MVEKPGVKVHIFVVSCSELLLVNWWNPLKLFYRLCISKGVVGLFSLQIIHCDCPVRFGSVLIHYVLTNWALQLADVTSKSLRHKATDPLDRWLQQIAASETWFDLLKSWKKHLELLGTSGSLKSSTAHLPSCHISSQFAGHLFFNTATALNLIDCLLCMEYMTWWKQHVLSLIQYLEKQESQKVGNFMKTPKLSCPLPYQDTLFQGPAKAFLRCFTWQCDKWLWRCPKLY